MGSSLRAGARIGAAGLFAAVTATLVLPGGAGAEETTPRVVTGQCPATFGDQDSKPVTLDAGALLDQPGALTIGLGNDAKGTGEQDDPTLALPVAEAVDTLGVNKVTVVRDATTGLCTFAKPVVNETNALLHGKPLADEPDENQPPDDEPTPPGDEPPPGGDEPPPGEDPGDEPGELPGGGGVNGPVVTDPGIGPGVDSRAPIDSFGPLGPIIGPPAAAIPPVAPPAPPGAGLPDPGPLPEVRAQDSGTAEAMPQASPPARLPLLFAVLALAIVAALLVRSWLRRKAAS